MQCTWLILGLTIRDYGGKTADICDKDVCSSLQIILLHSSKQRNQLLALCHVIYLQNQRKFSPTQEIHLKLWFQTK